MKDSELIFGLMAAFAKNEYTFADLKHLTVVFNVTETSLRTNLSRMTGHNIIKTRYEGKKVFYSFTPKGSKISNNIASSFTALDWNNWTNLWWGVIFSVPDIQKNERYYFRKKLLAYRFASLHPGFWIRPLHQTDQMDTNLEKIFLNPHCRVIQFNFFKKISSQEIDDLWGISQVNVEFKKALKTLAESNSGLSSLSPEEALVERMRIGNHAVVALAKNPLLPPIFLPDNWLGETLKKTFYEWDQTVTKLAWPYVRQIFEGGCNNAK